jgi:hypothetical protein
MVNLISTKELALWLINAPLIILMGPRQTSTYLTTTKFTQLELKNRFFFSTLKGYDSNKDIIKVFFL